MRRSGWLPPQWSTWRRWLPESIRAQRADPLWQHPPQERYTSDNDRRPFHVRDHGFVRPGAPPRSPRSALQLFGVVPLEPGMNSPVDGTSLVGFRAIAAVVAPVQYRKQEPTDEALAAYAEVVERVFEHMPILPAPPGAIFRSRSVISRWLELHYLALTDALGSLEGSASARVTIRLRNGSLTDDAAREWQSLAVESVRMLRGNATAISSHADAEDAKRADVLARTSFLIPREKWDSFESSVRAEEARHPHLEFLLSGPWPPYDFVRMQFGS